MGFHTFLLKSAFVSAILHTNLSYAIMVEAAQTTLRLAPHCSLFVWKSSGGGGTVQRDEMEARDVGQHFRMSIT